MSKSTEKAVIGGFMVAMVGIVAALAAIGSYFAAAGMLLVVGIYGMVMALTNSEPDWNWMRRICNRVRRYNAAWQDERRVEMVRHLNGLPPEARERELARLAEMEDEDSFLHPRNLPYDRVKPGRFD
jgi:hypothetical protein